MTTERAASAKDRAARTPSFDVAVETAYSKLVVQAVDEAAGVASVDTEVALLRVWLRDTSKEHKRDRDLMLKLFDRIIRAVAVKYRLSPKRTDDLAAAVAAVTKHLGDQMGMAEEV
jgi:hypothetical protein